MCNLGSYRCVILHNGSVQQSMMCLVGSVRCCESI